MPQNFCFIAKSSDQGSRLDKFLCGIMPIYSRAIIQKMIENKNILIGDAETKSSYRLKTGDIIEIKPPKDKIDLSPDPSIKITIIYNEKDFAVIDKPAGIVVYPGTKHEGKTLINGLLAIWPAIQSVGENPLRPGIVHRLDKDTSGVMIIVKNNTSFRYFKNLFKEKKVEKTYLALVFGYLTDTKGKIDFPIRRSKSNPIKQVAIMGDKNILEGREAITYFKILQYFSDKDGNKFSLAEIRPKTGRMHQIRVHLAAIGHPIVGDKIYQDKKNRAPLNVFRQMLHASAIKFISLSGEKMEFISVLPDDFFDFLKTLKQDKFCLLSKFVVFIFLYSTTGYIS